MEKQNEQEIKRTEQIADIVERMPTNGTKWILMIVIGLAFALLFFGVIIKYPEVVSGTITITTNNAPTVLVAKSAGRIQLLGNKPRIQVKAGEIIAVLYNTTWLDHLLVADSLLNKLSATILPDSSISFPNNLNLGELNSSYYQFINNYEKLFHYQTENTFDTREEAAKIELEICDTTLKYNIKQLEIKKMQLEFYRKEVSRDSIRLKIGDYIERELDRTKNTYNSMLENYHSLQENISLLQLKEKSIQNQLSHLHIERNEKECEMRTEYMATLNNLQSTISEWKERYAFIAPVEGTVEFLDFWRENDFIPIGKEAFSIIPGKDDVYGHMLLPSVGAGKVKKGQSVTIQLNDYPHLEFGSIKGKVSSISLITNKKLSNNNKKQEDNYLLTVLLPEGLTTKFGTSLDFRYEIKGSADIQTRKRRLIQRLFDNLKYISQE